MRIFVFLAIVSLLSAPSCTFTPDKKYFQQVEQTMPKASISLNNYDKQDTIYVFQATTFQFDISANGVFVKETDILLGQAQIYSTSAASGSFSIDGIYLKTGTFELKVQFTSNSGTGSLADKAGTETAQLWRSWVLIIDVDPPTKPVLQSSIENGFLKISWMPFLKRSFSKYIVQVNRGSYAPRQIKITDPSKTFCIDSTYVGGNTISYQVTTYTAVSNTTSEWKTISDPQQVVAQLNPSDSTVKLIWRKSKYPSAFKNVTIYQSGNNFGNPGSAIINNATDTVATIKLHTLFGEMTSVFLTINARYPFYQPFNYDYSIDHPVSPSLRNPSETFYYNKSLGAVMGFSKYYFNSEQGLLRTYNSSMRVIDSMSVATNFCMPYPGNYLYSYNTQFNLTTKSRRTFQVNGYYSQNLLPYIVSGSDNQLVSYGVKDSTYPWDIEYTSAVVDLTSNMKLSNYQMTLSDDGRYANWAGSVYQISGGVLTQLPNNNSAAHIFRPDNTDEMIYLGTPTTIRNTVDGTILRTIAPPDQFSHWVSYDPVTKNIMYKTSVSNKILLINIDTLQTTTVNAWSEACISFMNGILFSNNGSYLKLM